MARTLEIQKATSAVPSCWPIVWEYVTRDFKNIDHITQLTQVTFVVQTHLTLDWKSHIYFYWVVVGIRKTYQWFQTHFNLKIMSSNEFEFSRCTVDELAVAARSWSSTSLQSATPNCSRQYLVQVLCTGLEMILFQGDCPNFLNSTNNEF
jgi:hypothetical protein